MYMAAASSEDNHTDHDDDEAALVAALAPDARDDARRLAAIDAVVARASADPRLLPVLAASPTAFALLLAQLGHPAVDTAAAAAIAAFVARAAAACPALLDRLFSGDVASLLHDLAQRGDLPKFRVLDMLMATAAACDAASPTTTDDHGAFARIKGSGFFDMLISDLQSDDIMELLNTVETWTKLLDSSSGYQFMEKSGVIAIILSHLSDPPFTDISPHAADVTDTLKRSCILQFLSRLAVVRPHDLPHIEASHSITSILLAHLDRSDTTDAALVACGNVGSTATGLAILATPPSSSSSSHSTSSATTSTTNVTVLDALADKCRTSIGSIRLRAIESLSVILENNNTISLPPTSSSQPSSGQPAQPATTSPEQAAIAATLQRLTELAGGLAHFLRLTSNAFEEIQIAAYAVLNGLVRHEFGLWSLKGSAEFIANILDRGTPALSRTVKEWKFSVVVTVTKNPRARDVLSPETLARFERHVREGPLYATPVPIVAIQ